MNKRSLGWARPAMGDPNPVDKRMSQTMHPRGRQPAMRWHNGIEGCGINVPRPTGQKLVWRGLENWAAKAPRMLLRRTWKRAGLGFDRWEWERPMPRPTHEKRGRRVRKRSKYHRLISESISWSNRESRSADWHTDKNPGDMRSKPSPGLDFQNRWRKSIEEILDLFLSSLTS